MGGSQARALCVPKLRLTLSSTRTFSPKSGKFVTVIASLALASGALIAGMAAPSHPAGPPAATAAIRATGTASSGQPVRPVRADAELAPAGTLPLGQPTPQRVARKMLRSFGWTARQVKYLIWLWDAESSWNVFAENPSTGAYGIPQAVPGSKMSAAGPDWRTDAATQIRWGLTYISQSYGSPRSAWEHELAYGWY